MTAHASLLQWYTNAIRPFLLEYASERVVDLDADAEHLKALLGQAEEPVAVCFLGQAGKGKSTLINALVGGATTIVPFGGMQPLTAQGTVVRYSDKPCFHAEYLPATEVNNRLLFPLEKALERELKRVESVRTVSAARDAVDVAGSLSNSNDEDEPKEDVSRLGELERSARALVVASPTSDVPREYLVDGLRRILEKPTRFGSEFSADDAARIESVVRALATGSTVRESGVDDAGALRDDIADHATGHLASIVTKLEVGWPADLLRDGLNLVDLPGVGISGDIYEERTREWIRTRADVVVLVLEPRGMDEASARALRDSGFLNRLLHAGGTLRDDPAVLVLVTTRMDEPAESDWVKDRSIKKFQYLANRFEEARSSVTRQFHDQLLQLNQSTDADVASSQREVIARLVDTLVVHPLSSQQYRRFLADNEDDRPFIRDAEQSGVPAFASTLRRVALDRRERMSHALDEAASNLITPAFNLAKQVGAQWEERQKAAEEVERLKDVSETFLNPLRIQIAARRGAFQEFLASTRTRTIPDKVDIALGIVSKDLAVLAREFSDRHWASLRAAVRRGGFYDRREINFTASIADRSEPPIADAWAKQILAPVREKTAEQIKAEVSILDLVVEWAADEAPSSVARLKIEQDSIRADSRALAAVGETLMSDLRKKVRDHLAVCVEKAVMNACTGFVMRGQDRGSGAGDRVRRFMGNELMPLVVEALKRPVKDFLVGQYASVERGTRDRFQKRPNPIQEAAEILVPSERAVASRGSVEQQARVQRALSEIREGAPK